MILVNHNPRSLNTNHRIFAHVISHVGAGLADMIQKDVVHQSGARVEQLPLRVHDFLAVHLQ